MYFQSNETMVSEQYIGKTESIVFETPFHNGLMTETEIAQMMLQNFIQICLIILFYTCIQTLIKLYCKTCVINCSLFLCLLNQNNCCVKLQYNQKDDKFKNNTFCQSSCFIFKIIVLLLQAVLSISVLIHFCYQLSVYYSFAYQAVHTLVWQDYGMRIHIFVCIFFVCFMFLDFYLLLNLKTVWDVMFRK